MEKRNILLIMADQLRADWVGEGSEKYVDTPGIRRLVSRGMRFSRAICNSPLCAPSRISTAGGVYPHRLGALDNDANFPVDAPTYYQQLRRCGYRVGVVGKTDLHKADDWWGSRGDLPLLYHLGFTDPLDTEGKANAAHAPVDANGAFQPLGPYQRYLLAKNHLAEFVADYSNRRSFPVWHAAPSVLPEEDFHDSYIGRKACAFLENVPEEDPWHLFVSFVGPHDPWDPPTAYLEAYKAWAYPPSVRLSPDGKPPWVRERAAHHSGSMSEADCVNVKRHYAGAVSLIDHWIGEIMDTLERRGLQNNTTVIFTADHGELLGDHGLFQKSAMYEGALRVPLVVADSRMARGTVSDALVSLVDLYPTILDLAGIAVDHELDGRSLVPVLTGERRDHAPWQFSELRNCRMVFDGRYKLIENYNEGFELYDLLDDPEESRNLAASRADKRKELQAVMRSVR